jgi:hypothetical protein
VGSSDLNSDGRERRWEGREMEVRWSVVGGLSSFLVELVVLRAGDEAIDDDVAADGMRRLGCGRAGSCIFV